jgi:hypothetical protein
MANRLNVQNIYASDSQSTPSVTIDGSGISAGTLGSGVVFPAGHVIQTATGKKIWTGDLQFPVSGAYRTIDSSECALTLVNSNAKVLVKILHSEINISSGTGFLGVAYKAGSAFTATDDNSNNQSSYAQLVRGQWQINFLDVLTLSNSANDTYYFRPTFNSSSTSNYIQFGGASGRTVIVVQEIQ